MMPGQTVNKHKVEETSADMDAQTLGLKSVGKVYHNLGYDEIFEHERKNEEG